MTHDELLTRIDNVTYAHDKSHTIDKDRIVKQLNGLRAVVELHKEVKLITARSSDNSFELSQQVCKECTGLGSAPIPYPCFTIQAIEKEL